MSISRKCQYALRAVFELAKRRGASHVSVSEIAAAQDIPPRFLELIFRELKQGGFIASRRGGRGGYVLTADPAALNVGEIIRFIDGPVDPVECARADQDSGCALFGKCVFVDLWARARTALEEVYDTTTFQDLVEQEQAAAGCRAISYSI